MSDIEITKKGLAAMNQTILLFENTNEIKLYLIKFADLEINKANNILNNIGRKKSVETTYNKHYVLVKSQLRIFVLISLFLF